MLLPLVRTNFTTSGVNFRRFRVLPVSENLGSTVAAVLTDNGLELCNATALCGTAMCELLPFLRYFGARLNKRSCPASKRT